MHVTRKPVNHNIDAAGDVLHVVSSVDVPELEGSGKSSWMLVSELDPQAPLEVRPCDPVSTSRTAAQRLHAVYQRIIRDHEDVVTRDLDMIEANGIDVYCVMVDAMASARS